MTEVLGLVAVAWLVYVFDALWWVGPDQIVLSGSGPRGMRAQSGPSFTVRGDDGVFIPGMTPAFDYQFEVDASGAGGKAASEAVILETARTAITAARTLQRLGSLLWTFCFLVAPALMLALGLRRVWMLLVAVLFSGAIAIVVCFARAWRRIHPADRTGWKNEAVPLVLSPLAAIRAANTLTRKACSSFDALAVVSALATEDDFLKIARLHYFAPDNGRLERLLASKGLEAAVLAPPAQAGSEMKGYCPRCHVQLVRDSGDCPECQDVPVVAFGAVTPSGALSGTSRSAAPR